MERRLCREQGPLVAYGGRRGQEGALMGRDGQEGSVPSDPGCVQSCCQSPPAAAVNTVALYTDRDRHSQGRGRVGWKGLRQRGLSGKPLRHLYLTESPEGSHIEGSS